MTWNVYRRDMNSDTIEVYNIFRHHSFKESVTKLKKNKKLTKEEFEGQLNRECMYYFWSKYEMENVITSWPPYITQEELTRLNEESQDHYCNYEKYPRVLNVRLKSGSKIDIYDQLKLNWDRFVDYVWEATI